MPMKPIFAALALAVATPANAAPIDYEWLRVHPEELQQTEANIATLDQIFGAIYAQGWDALRGLYAANYVQHNPDMADRVDGVIELFSSLDFSTLVYEPVMQIAEGPYVIAFSRLQFAPDQPMLGVVDINFIRDGQSREHWDIIQPVANAEDFFAISAPAPPTDRAKIEANKDRVADFINTVFNGGNTEAARDFIAPGYIQHGQGDDGVEAVIEDARTRFAGAEVDIKRIIAQDDLVLVHSRVTAGPDHTDFSRVDIWRVTDGMLTEHWGLMQPVPDGMRHRNGMF